MQPRSSKVFLALSVMVTLGLLLSACAPAAPAAPSPTKAPVVTAPTPVPSKPTPAPAPAEERPQYGGILNIATYTDAPSYDIHQETTIGTLLPVAPTYNGIVQYSPEDNTKVIGDLAERWEVSPDGLTYTFYFVKGVKWHDGKPFTAADAKFTLDRIRKPPQGMNSVRRDNFVGIKDVDVVDDNTLKVTLKYPMASFVPLVAMGWNAVVPKHVVEPLGGKKISTKEAIGTGPYIFKDYVRGVNVTLAKNPNYFIKGRPYVDGMDIFIITDPGATLAAIRTGQVHHVSGVMLTPEEAGIVRKSAPEIKLMKAKSLLFPHFGVNAQRKPYNDVRVRKAIFLALDRQAANRVLQDNEGEIGGPLSPGSYFALPQEELLKMPGYRQPKDADIAEAKKLMAEAGYPDGFDAEIKTWGSKINSDLAVLLIDQMRAINIRMKMRYMETAAFYAAANNRDFEVYAWSMGVAIEDPDQMFAEHYITKAPRNYGDYTIPGFDELYLKQSQTMDREERRKIVWEMQRMVMDHYLKAVAFWRTVYAPVRPEMHGYYGAVGLYNNLKFQDVWLSQK